MLQIVTALRSQIAILTLVTVGCVRPPAVGTPPAPSQNDPAFRVNQAIGILAESNKGATQLVIQIDKAGLLPHDKTRAVLDYNRKIALFVKAAVTVMQSSKTPAEKAAAIAPLIASIGPAVGIDATTANELSAGAAAAVAAVQSMVTLIRDLLAGMSATGATFGASACAEMSVGDLYTCRFVPLSEMPAGALRAGLPVRVVFDGANWQVMQVETMGTDRVVITAGRTTFWPQERLQ